jgi:predicted regulator of Ras-like GTPase activity (Roadblock/LC7/MglB family)
MTEGQIMAKKKKSIQETATTLVVAEETATPAVEEDQTFTSLCTNLAEINKRKGVIGYILRNATSAAIDLKDPTKLVEYAILSSQALDSSKEISELFDLGDSENILIEGRDSKALCMAIGENKVAVFMEKDADHADILRRVSP